eukprot:5893408-Pleurochrysis_carterae.AAC.1
MCKWGHLVATLPSDEGDCTSLWSGNKFCESLASKQWSVIPYDATTRVHTLCAISSTLESKI